MKLSCGVSFLAWFVSSSGANDSRTGEYLEPFVEKGC